MPAFTKFAGSNIVGVPLPPPSALLSGITAGPLLLWEPGHPDAPYSGVPQTGTMPDLAATLSAATIGSAPGEFAITSSINNAGAKTKIERTAKGGVHIMASQANQDTTYETWKLGLGTARLNYVNANPSHQFYLGLWFRKTRQSLLTGTASAQVVGLFRSDPVSTPSDRWLTAGPNSTSSHITTAPAAAASNASSGSPVTIDDANAGLLMFAGVGATAAPASFAALDPFVAVGAKNAGQANKMPSVALYRAYFEDLTVSGRDFPTVAAIDRGEFVAQCQTAGGRYYGDTWSNPATALP